MKRILSFSVAGLLAGGSMLPHAAFALELQPALEQLKSYKSGEEQDSIAALETAVKASLGNATARADLAKTLADFLSKPADDGAKVMVSLYAAVVADDVLVPVAQNMLKNPALARSGASILRATHTPKSEAALVAGLAIPAAQVDVLNSFWAQSSDAAVGAIGKLLGGNVSPDVFAAGATALARANTGSAVGTLAALAESSKGDRRIVATDRAVILLDNLTATKDSTLGAHAIPVLARLAKLSDLPPQLSGAIFIAQVRLDPAGNAAALASRLAGESLEGFTSAIAALRVSPDPAAIKSVLAALPKAPVSHVPALVAALVAREAKAAYPAVLELAAQNPAVVVPALEAFRKLGDISQAPKIIAFAEKEPVATGKALSLFPSKDLGALIVSQLKSAPPATQGVLVDALAERRDLAAFEPLVPLANSDNAVFRRKVLNALDVLSQPKDVPVLLATYQKATTEAARVPLARALRRNLADPASAPSAPAVRAALNSEKDPAAKYGILALVVAIGSPEDLKLLQASWPEEGPARRDWFKTAAFWSGGADGWDVVKARITEEKEPGARQLGIQALADLVTDNDEIPAAQSGAYLRDLVALAGENDDALRYLLSKIGKVPDKDLVVTVEEIGKRPALGEESLKATKQLKESISRAVEAEKARG